MTLEEIKARLRAAKDAGDGKAIEEGLRLFAKHHPERFQAFMVDIQKLMDTPGGRMQ